MALAVPELRREMRFLTAQHNHHSITFGFVIVFLFSLEIQMVGQNKKETFPLESKGGETSDPNREQSTCCGSLKIL